MVQNVKFLQFCKVLQFWNNLLTRARVSSVVVGVRGGCRPLDLVVQEDHVRFLLPASQHGLERVSQGKSRAGIRVRLGIAERQVRHGHDEGPLEPRRLPGEPFLQEGINLSERGGIRGLAVSDISA